MNAFGQNRKPFAIHRHQLLSVLSLVSLLIQGIAAQTDASTKALFATDLKVNGWYGCALNSDKIPSSGSSGSGSDANGGGKHIRPFTVSPDGIKAAPWNEQIQFSRLDAYKSSIKDVFSSLPSECAEFVVPYCHPNACTDSSKKTINVFAKRILATKRGLKQRAVWVLQGGPGASSVNMESIMVSLYYALNGAYTIYTMDHRGTGRSNLLDCPASQATAAGSPGGKRVTQHEISSCLQDLRFQYGNSSDGFSVTNAAADIAAIIQSTLANSEVYVYGVSYGTYLVERLMHLAPSNVKGFILDSVQAETFIVDSDLDSYFSNWDRDYNQVALRYLDYCNKDQLCASKIGPSASDTIVQLYDALDRNTTACGRVAWENFSSGSSSPSMFLRTFLASLFMDMDKRALIAPFVYRMKRCNPTDIDVLKTFLAIAGDFDSGAASSVPDSEILYNTIVFSEIWQRPTLSTDQLGKIFEASVMATGTYDQVSFYCAYTNYVDAACAEYKATSLTSDTNGGFRYERDPKYWNVTAKVPTDASVLVLCGGLDPQTPSKYAQLQYQLMQGNNKKLVEFPYAAHGTIDTTPVGTSFDPPCGLSVIVSYLAQGGNLASMDTSCVSKVNGLSFVVEKKTAEMYFGTADAFEGALDPSLLTKKPKSKKKKSQSNGTTTTGSSQSTQFKTPLIVVSVFLGLCVIAVIVLVFAFRKMKTKYRNLKTVESLHAVDTPPANQI